MSTHVVIEDVELDVRPVAGYIGAEVTGVRLSGKLDPALVHAIRQVLLKYKVLFFRGQGHLDEATHEPAIK